MCVANSSYNFVLMKKEGKLVPYFIYPFYRSVSSSLLPFMNNAYLWISLLRILMRLTFYAVILLPSNIQCFVWFSITTGYSRIPFSTQWCSVKYKLCWRALYTFFWINSGGSRVSLSCSHLIREFLFGRSLLFKNTVVLNIEKLGSIQDQGEYSGE